MFAVSFRNTLLAVALLAMYAAPGARAGDDVIDAGALSAEQAVVIGRSFVRGGSRTSDLMVGFRRFDPPTPDAGFSWWGEPGEFYARVVPPGRYRLSVWDDGDIIFSYQPFEPRYTVEIQPGEAVYIGDVITQLTGNGRFRMVFETEEAAAEQYFERNLSGGALIFTTRKARRVPNEARLPK